MSLRATDGRLGLAITGLAGFGTFNTRQWLFDTIIEAGQAAADMQGLLDTVVERATAKINKLACSDDDKRLTIVGVGYQHTPDETHRKIAFISNWERQGQPESPVTLPFAAEFASVEPGTVFATGALHKRLDPHLDGLPALANSDAPASAVANKARIALWEYAQMPQSNGLVGEGSSTLYIPADLSKPVLEEYHAADPNQGLSRQRISDVIMAMAPGQTVGMRDMELKLDVGDTPTRPRTRNSPCWCNSGKKFKRCHGKQQDMRQLSDRMQESHPWSPGG